MPEEPPEPLKPHLPADPIDGGSEPPTAPSVVSVPKPTEEDGNSENVAEQQRTAAAQDDEAGGQDASGKQPDPPRNADAQNHGGRKPCKESSKGMRRKIDVGLATQISLVFFQMLLFGATIWADIITKGAADDGKIAAQAAASSAATAKTGLELAQRAVIAIALNPTQDLSTNHIVGVLQNRGLGPALQIAVDWNGDITNAPDFATKADYADVLTNSKPLEEADRSYDTGFFLPTKQSTIDKTSSYPDGQRILLRVYGKAVYVDLLKNAHVAWFCEVYAGSNKLTFTRIASCQHPGST